MVCIAALLCLLSFLLLVYTGYEYKSSKTNEIILEEAREDAHKQAHSALNKLDKELNSTRFVTERIAKNLSSGKLKDDSMLRERLLAEMEKNPSIFSIVVAYSPTSHAGKLYAPHFKRNGSDIVYAPVTYDYTKDNEKTAWYNDVLKKGYPVWTSPYFGIADGTYQIDYSAPFYLAESGSGDEVAGVVSVSHSLDRVRMQVGGLDLGDTGYGFILSREGVIISHPIQEYVNRNIHELAKEDPEHSITTKNMIEEEQGIMDSRTGQSHWVSHENIPATNWTLEVVLPQEETLLDKKMEQNRSVIQVMLATFAFLFFLSLLLVSLYRYDHSGLWLLAFIFALLCVLGIGFIWHLTMNSSTLDGRNGDRVVFDREDAETVLQHANTSPTASRIPTGLFLQSMEFLNANNVVITGYIWQNISTLGAEKDLLDFSFPDSKETTIEKAFVNKDKGVIGWRFKITLRQKFDYSRYPFDREAVSIRVLSNNSAGNLLIPDFDSYDSLIPETLPGLECSFVLEGWKPQKTFFSYRIKSYNANFGVGNFANSSVPEFRFNIDIKRDFKESFGSDLLLIMVVVVLLFAALTMTTKSKNKNNFEFSPQKVLGYCTSLLFTLIIAHSSLKSRIPIDNIIYLEYFYFVMYLAILVVALNAIAFGSNTDFPFIDTKDNIYVKVLYWPVIMGILLLITLLNFYY